MCSVCKCTFWQRETEPTCKGPERLATSSWKYRQSKLALAGILHTVVRDANGVSAENETKKKCHFSFLHIRKRSGYFNLGLFSEL